MNLRKTVTAAVIAAVYAAITLLLLPISFGTIQCRISEVLTVLAIFSPVSTVGLTLGCFVSNLFSTVSPLDIIFGTAATFIAAVLSRSLRKITVFKIPILSLFSPVVVNAVIIGLEMTFFVSESASFSAFLISATSVALGQTVPCVILGIPFYFALNKKGFFNL